MSATKSNLLSVIDGKTGRPVQRIADKRCRAKLDTAQDLRRELAKVYRECRSGLLESSEATKLTYILIAIQKVIESSDMEARMARLESDSVD